MSNIYLDKNILKDMVRLHTSMDKNFNVMDYLYNKSKTPIDIKFDNRVIFKLNFAQIVIINKLDGSILGILHGESVIYIKNKIYHKSFIFNKDNKIEIVPLKQDAVLNGILNLRREELFKEKENYPNIKLLVDECPFELGFILTHNYYKRFLLNPPESSLINFDDIDDKISRVTDYRRKNGKIYLKSQCYYKSKLNGWFYHTEEIYEKDKHSSIVELIEERFIDIEYHDNKEFIKKDIYVPY